MKNAARVMTLLSALFLVRCGGQGGAPPTTSSTAQGLARVDGRAGDDQALEGGTARGAFTCDFEISAAFPPDAVPGILERDRMYMAARPGMIQKHVPIRPAGGGLPNHLSGGRYLFETAAQAEEYKRWIMEDFELDGVPFLQRDYFIGPDCHAWRVIGSRDFADISTSQVSVRTERWSLPDGNHEGHLRARWKLLEQMAADQGMTSVWLVHNREERLASIIYYANRVASAPHDPEASRVELESAAALGRVFDGTGWNKVMDRTQIVWTIWFPFVPGDNGEPSLWPNAPALPQPSTSDGVCSVSRGEDSVNAPEDCLPTCGNRREDPGETSKNCPGDVRLF